MNKINVLFNQLPGVTDHGALTGLGDDDHTQYHNDARGDARYEVVGAVAAHAAAGDPHPVYLTTAEGNAVYSLLGHTHLLASVTDVTMTVVNLNTLDDGANTSLHFHDADRARAVHTGTQLAATISDFSEAVDDRVAALLIQGANITLTYNDAANTLTVAAAGGGGGSLSAASIPFTDGDTSRRITIADAAVTATSKIVGMIRRPDTANDSADRGYLYVANVVRIATGVFDLLVAAVDWGLGDCSANPPNETVTFTYQVT